MLDRRAFLRGSLRAGAAWLVGCGDAPDPSLAEAFAGGERIGVVPWPGDGAPRFGAREGAGWDGRRYADLSRVDASAPTTPAGGFFVRTFEPASLAARRPAAADWTIRLGGLAGPDVALPLASLRARPQGRVVLECAGNDASAHFGLMGCAEWSGVPLAELLTPHPPRPGAVALRVGGVDDHAQPSRRDHSRPGASWVFERAQLARSGAFLATAMGGAPLAPDHGAPVRLVVPGWYGCAHVKWVDAIDWVGADEPATSQMREFARRTHQRGVPALAREYHPATIDAAALPVRVERWRVRGETLLRIVGIVWGGDGSERALRIRVGPSGAWQPVALDDALRGHGWQLWQHTWRPAHGGRHTIHCRFDDAASQRRQRTGFHDRAIVL